MITYLRSGEQFQPTKDELLMVLLFLKGTFAPNTFDLFEISYDKRNILVENFEKPYLYMDILSKNKNYPDFNSLENNIENLSFSDCAQYLLFYLRFAKRQGGGNAFISMWRSGIIEKLVNRMLGDFDGCTLD